MQLTTLKTCDSQEYRNQLANGSTVGQIINYVSNSFKTIETN